MTSYRGSFKANSFEMNEFPNQPFKKISNDFDKINLLFQTVSGSEDTSLLPTDQLDFTVGPSKCPINKMIGSQGHLTVWRVPWVLCEQAKSSLLKFFSKWIIFQIRHFKKLIAVYIDYKKVKLTTINFHGRTNVNILCKHSLCDFVKIPQMFLAFPC